jgi:hypothetical protein
MKAVKVAYVADKEVREEICKLDLPLRLTGGLSAWL